ncbi:MAG: DUF6183 family protein [Acidimicrobiia bacterium]
MIEPAPYSEAINTSDDAELLRWVDRFDAARSFDDLVDLAWACEHALDRGHQLGGITAHAAYRLALHAPVAEFGEVMEIADDRFTPGPFAEVLAFAHDASEIANELPDSALRSVALAECAVRGASIADSEMVMFDTPGTLATWEPEYALASYTDTESEIPTYQPSPTSAQALATDRITPPHSPERSNNTQRALHDVVAHWAEHSTGRVESVTVEGDVHAALATLGIRRGMLHAITPRDAFGLLAWAGASGAAHGRRRGAAAGRFAAWWAGAALTGTEWPCDPDELGHALESLDWFTFDAGIPALGWQFRIAATDVRGNRTWAVTAEDMS